MRYRIENYIALKLHNNLEELQEVVNGFGVVECDDLEYTNAVSYKHLRSHETGRNIVFRIML